MTHLTLVNEITRLVGKVSVRLRTEYHLQVVVDVVDRKEHYHDIWLNKFGRLRWRLYGHKKTRSGSLGNLLADIERYTPERSDYGRMKRAWELAEDIHDVAKIFKINSIQRGIFVDAGFKDGKAKISMIKIDGENIDARVRVVEAINSQAAERLAVQAAMAMDYYDPSLGYTIPIFSDCRSIIFQFHETVKWLPREHNKAADKLANLRKS